VTDDTREVLSKNYEALDMSWYNSQEEWMRPRYFDPLMDRIRDGEAIDWKLRKRPSF